MNRVLALFFGLILCVGVVAEESFPIWKPIIYNDRKEQVFYEKDREPGFDGQPVVWIYIIYKKPRPATARYFRNQLFKAEIQEWVVNCSNNTARIVTIRYTNEVYPEKIRKVAIAHTFVIEDPPTNEVALVCKLIN